MTPGLAVDDLGLQRHGSGGGRGRGHDLGLQRPGSGGGGEAGAGAAAFVFDPTVPCPAPPWKMFRCQLRRVLADGSTAPAEVVLSEQPPLAFVWEAGAVMAMYLESLPPGALGGRSVIDVGAGTGIAAVAAGLAGAGPVLATEVPCYLDVLERNISACGLKGTVATQYFPWEGLRAEDVAVPPPFDFVLAADVLYRREAWGDIARCLGVLAGAGSVVVLSFLLRGPEMQFFDLPEVRGVFTWERVGLQPEWCSRERIPFRSEGEEANAAAVHLFLMRKIVVQY